MFPNELKIYFIALALITLSFCLIYFEMISAHEIAHQKIFSYFGINSTVVFYSPFEAATIPQNFSLNSSDTRFLYFLQAFNEIFEYQFLAAVAFMFLAMLAILTAIFILIGYQKTKQQEES